MSENWKLQLSVKIDGSHLFNLRGDTVEDFDAILKWSVKNAEQIQAATAALEGTKSAPAPTPASRPFAGPRASVAQSGPSGEVGPVMIVGVSKTAIKKDGTPMKSPKYTVEFAGGKKFSTFDAATGQAAETLSGRSVYYSTKVNGEYTNLSEIRKAD